MPSWKRYSSQVLSLEAFFPKSGHFLERVCVCLEDAEGTVSRDASRNQDGSLLKLGCTHLGPILQHFRRGICLGKNPCFEYLPHPLPSAGQIPSLLGYSLKHSQTKQNWRSPCRCTPQRTTALCMPPLGLWTAIAVTCSLTNMNSKPSCFPCSGLQPSQPAPMQLEAH